MRQMLASGFGGVCATAVDVSALVLQVRHGMSIPLAAFVSAALGAAVGFTVNKYIAFRDRSRITAPQLARFGIVAVATALLMAVAMQLVAVKLAVPYLIAKVVCSVLVFIAWTYPAQRRLVFRRLAPSSS
jgi:putative flippase GtrA